MSNRNLVIEGAKLLFKNFSGKGGTYNPEGVRNFCVLLDQDIAERLAADGWNVRPLKPLDEGDTPKASLRVAVSYAKRPPKIVLISNGKKQVLDEEDIGILDWAEIEKADVSINPSYWEVGDRHGIKAYLSSLYVTIVDDELERKYADVPEAQDSAKSSLLSKKQDDDLTF